MADIFISYAKNDLVEQGGLPGPYLKGDPRCLIRRLENSFKDLGLDVWRDVSMLSGTEFQNEINKAINGSSVVLVCWSPLSVKSDWVRAEADIGRARGRLVPVVLRQTDIPAPFNIIQASSMGRWDGTYGAAEFQTVAEAVGKLLKRPGLAEFAKLLQGGSYEAWRKWMESNRNDALTQRAIQLATTAHAEELARQFAPPPAARRGTTVNGYTESQGNEDEANVYYAISASQVQDILQDMGYRATVEPAANDKLKVATKLQGFNVSIIFYGDTLDKHPSFQMIVWFNGNQGHRIEHFNYYNNEKRFAKVSLDKDGDMMVEMDVIIEGGVHRNFIKTCIERFDTALSLLGPTLDEAVKKLG